MGFKVLITDSALGDLKEIVEFVAQDDPQAAEKLGEKLIRLAMRLESLPERYPCHDARRGIRKMPVPPYIVYFSCSKDAGVVYILHFWHGARLSPRFP